MCSSKTTKKVAMVTGGASGIGTATCRRFAKEGYIPVIVDVNLDTGSVDDAIDGFAALADDRSDLIDFDLHGQDAWRVR